MNAIDKLKQLLSELGITLVNPKSVGMYEYINTGYNYANEEKRVYLENNFPSDIDPNHEEEFFKYFKDGYYDKLFVTVTNDKLNPYSPTYILLTRIINLLFTNKLVNKYQLVNIISEKANLFKCDKKDYHILFQKYVQEDLYKALILLPDIDKDYKLGDIDLVYNEMKHYIIVALSDSSNNFQEYYLERRYISE